MCVGHYVSLTGLNLIFVNCKVCYFFVDILYILKVTCVVRILLCASIYMMMGVGIERYLAVCR
jgi:hypothetical protein